jgi:hypothetical protein
VEYPAATDTEGTATEMKAGGRTLPGRNADEKPGKSGLF